jgi:hypothetical protein
VEAQRSIIQDGLALYLDPSNPQSYPGTGTTWTDLSGNGRTGTLVNGPIFKPGNYGAISFDGTNDYVSFPAPSLTLTSCTMLVWLKRNGNQANWAAVLFDRLTAGNSTYAGILFRGDNGATGTNQIIFAWHTLRVPAGQADLVLADNTWYMVAMSVYNEYYARFLVYGPSGIVSREVSTYIGPAYTFTGLQIAKESSYTDRNFKGDIGIAAVYNRGLTDAELQENFNATRHKYGV